MRVNGITFFNTVNAGAGATAASIYFICKNYAERLYNYNHNQTGDFSDVLSTSPQQLQ